jgi:hypothetical protein
MKKRTLEGIRDTVGHAAGSICSLGNRRRLPCHSPSKPTCHTHYSGVNNSGVNNSGVNIRIGAATRTMPRPVTGWRWNERLRELGPQPDLHARSLVWKQSTQWPKRWPEYEAAYREWMAHDPCARLLAALERRVRLGQTVALACWCETPISCHRLLIGLEMDKRGVMVEFV